MPDDKVRAFISKWRGVELRERAAAQEHFIDVCRMIGHATPAEMDETGDVFTFEKGVEKTGGGHGWADVWYRDHFAWEYKGPHKDLDAAYNQLLRYHENLEQPPLLVVSDMLRFEIHTKWPNTMPRVYRFGLEELTEDGPYKWLRDLFFEPEALHPREYTDKLTIDAAKRFARLADALRDDNPPRKVAHFLTQVVFCLFAEDIGLLPRGPKGDAGIFSEIIETCLKEGFQLFPRYTADLFRAMARGGHVLFKEVAHFNGGLFSVENGNFDVPLLNLDELNLLRTAAGLNWSAVEPSIFGTLFERGLNPELRGQLGAHYTSKDDIVAIVEPVLMAPLRREWAALQEQHEGESAKRLQDIRDGFLDKLASVRVLDPACGSGNFLYVSLNLLKDLEKQVIEFPAFAGLPPAEPRVSPAQLYGIEISDYAHELASVVVWIGYIQWHKNNGYSYQQRPILQKLNNIECKDAILSVTGDGELYRPEWPEVDIIVGNPPFLGGNKIRQELGSDIVDDLFSLYRELPNSIDLVCYWFEQAREHIMQGKAKRAGLLATQGIRGGANREVLQKIQDTGSIFFAYSDRPWILDGAAVRVSMVGFDNGGEAIKALDGTSVSYINSDLTAVLDLTQAKVLSKNEGIAFRGNQKGGPFDIPNDLAEQMLGAPPNPNGRLNSDVLKRWLNGDDITGRPRDMWLIDFGIDKSLEEAALYEGPFEYIKKHVAPKYAARKPRWWIHERPRPEMRRAIALLDRYIVTPHVSKHRVFKWLDNSVLPDHQLIVFARDDDYFFGVLHSKAHELWSLRQGTQLREKESGNRYTPTTTFETFPLPWIPGHEPTDNPCYKDIAEAARDLNEKRERWLNPERTANMEEQEWQRLLKKRTLTALYNERPTWLQQAHEKLDRAVFAAYGWAYPLADEEILRRLLALNLERAE